MEKGLVARRTGMLPRNSCALLALLAAPLSSALPGPLDAPSPLLDYFNSVKSGPGVWKWRHYFPIYERHFARFRNTDAVIVEIGIYSGGSLRMWRNYFGQSVTIIGVDIANATKIYEGKPAYGSPQRIVLGDQSDPAFWKRFKRKVPRVDVLIDDGGHARTMQKPTLDAMWEHLAPGGVYLCEDLHGAHNLFARDVITHFITGSMGVNNIPTSCSHLDSAGKSAEGDCKEGHATGEVQPYLAEAAFYPYVITLTKRAVGLQFTEAPRHGTEWQPPYKEFVAKYTNYNVLE